MGRRKLGRIHDFGLWYVVTLPSNSCLTRATIVDQPVGTGFSYASSEDYVHDLDQAASQVVEFMRNFYAVFPEFQSMEASGVSPL